MTATGFCIRHSSPGDAPAIVELLNRVFAPREEGYHPRDAAWWAWKYESNPAGRHSIVVEDQEGRVIGHYGGVPLRMRCDARDVVFSQNCDSVTDPDVRRGLRNPGTFVRLAQAYASTFGRRDCDAVMYGLPIPEAYRIGSRYLDYWMLRSQQLLVCRAPEGLPPWAPEIHALPVESFPAECDEVAARLERAYPCAARRDAAFLNWRFRDHWERPYRMAVARHGEGGPLRGHVVYRDGTFAARRLGLIADWWVDPSDDAAARSLLRWATERAAQGGHGEIGFLCPTTSHWFARFQDWGFEVDRTPYVTVARPYDQRFPPARLLERWYYTFAEFDIA
jgi:hypothetical protein